MILGEKLRVLDFQMTGRQVTLSHPQDFMSHKVPRHIENGMSLQESTQSLRKESRQTPR